EIVGMTLCLALQTRVCANEPMAPPSSYHSDNLVKKEFQMKRFLLPLLLLTTAAVGAQASEIGWKKGYDTAAAEAKSSGKLIMIDMYTDWCVWCKRLDSDTYPAAEVVKQSEKFVPIKLNAEKDADGIRLAKKVK